MNIVSAESAYDLRGMQLPPLTGLKLKAVVSLLESPVGGLLVPRLLRETGITWFRGQTFSEPPIFRPPHSGPLQADAAAIPPADWPVAPEVRPAGFRFATAHDYALAYRNGVATPVEIGERIFRAIQDGDQGDQPLRAFIAVNREDILRQAEASTERLRAGQPLGPLDGVPIAAKDELDMTPYPTTAGASFLGSAPATRDATVIERLRAAGALLIGKLNMHEIGMGVTGLNANYGTPRNPYDLGRHTGGSSSGSAAVLAAGLCPISIGADGGGSIRIPAALCGVVGLKPTYGRISERGAMPLCYSVGHLGPLGATVTDAILGYAAIAGPDPRDPTSLRQPLPDLDGLNTPDLRGIKLGVYWPWFRHADPEIVAACEGMLERLRGQGAEVREITIPDLEAARVAHTVTICSEMATSMADHYRAHRRELGRDARLALRVARALTATDYVHAQRVRARMLGHFARAFAEVDAIVTPATGTVAPVISAAALASGISDLSLVSELMRFATPANLTGHPAIAFPVGYTSRGLPIGLQAMSRPWEESLLFRIALSAERLVEVKRPSWHFQPLAFPTP